MLLALEFVRGRLGRTNEWTRPSSEAQEDVRIFRLGRVVVMVAGGTRRLGLEDEAKSW